MLWDARQVSGLTQRALGARAGLSQQEVSRLELGNGGDAGLDTWAVCAAAVGRQLAAFFEQTAGADVPRDIEHLKSPASRRRHRGRGRLASGTGSRAPAGWPPHPRSIDVLLTRAARREAAVVEIWDLLLDGGGAMRGLECKVLDPRERVGPNWNVQGLLVVRGTHRNRELVAGARRPIRGTLPRVVTSLASRAPGSGDAAASRRWLRMDRCQRRAPRRVASPAGRAGRVIEGCGAHCGSGRAVVRATPRSGGRELRCPGTAERGCAIDGAKERHGRNARPYEPASLPLRPTQAHCPGAAAPRPRPPPASARASNDRASSACDTRPTTSPPSITSR